MCMMQLRHLDGNISMPLVKALLSKMAAEFLRLKTVFQLKFSINCEQRAMM